MILGALEAGGTKMVCAIGNESGEILEQVSIPTETPEITIPKLLDFFRGKQIEALGIGCFGPIDVDRDSETYGYITTTPKLAWQNYNIVGAFKKELGVPVVNTFSGCPGGSPEDKTPNWVTCPWPDDFSRILEYQWNEVLIPYWKEKAAFAAAHGVHKIALELHPGFCVYNTRTLLKLREAVGPEIGANFDPSHLIWQGMDPCVSIRELGKAGALFHFHAKDTKVDKLNTAMNGVLDTTHYGRELERSWIFRSVGYGHGEDYWKAIISELRLAGYDYAISIEHEDSLMSGREGLLKAIQCLKNVLIYEDRGNMYWA